MTPEQIPNSWIIAQQRCWTHVEVATQMMRTLDTLKHLPAASVIPILSDTTPTIVLTPEEPNNVDHVKLLCCNIASCLQTNNHWLQVSVNAEWTLRLKSGNLSIDVMTALPAVQETPLSL